MTRSTSPISGRATSSGRRQVLTVRVTSVAAIAIVGGSVLGLERLIRGEQTTPIGPTTRLEPPGDAEIRVASGSYEGWEWLLSASPDGTCVALTDSQGSTTDCATVVRAPEPGFSGTDVVAIGVRSAPSPAPDAIFVFGRVSRRVVKATVETLEFDQREAQLFVAPPDIPSSGFYVATVPGYPYPVVPSHMSVWAQDAEGNWIDAVPVPRPAWAEDVVPRSPSSPRAPGRG